MIMTGNLKKDLAVFYSLMAVKMRTHDKTREELMGELKELEDQGQLKIYYPVEK